MASALLGVPLGMCWVSPWECEKDLGTLTQQLIKLTVETALNAEMDEHLGYEKHAPQGRGTGNNRNGYSTKRLKGQHGEVTIQTPRDRNASFGNPSPKN